MPMHLCKPHPQTITSTVGVCHNSLKDFNSYLDYTDSCKLKSKLQSTLEINLLEGAPDHNKVAWLHAKMVSNLCQRQARWCTNSIQNKRASEEVGGFVFFSFTIENVYWNKKKRGKIPSTRQPSITSYSDCQTLTKLYSRGV